VSLVEGMHFSMYKKVHACLVITFIPELVDVVLRRLFELEGIPEAVGKGEDAAPSG